MKKNLSKFITIGFLALFAIYALNNKDIFYGLKSVSIASILLITVGRLAVFVSNGLFTKWTAEAFTKKLTTGEGIYVGILSAAGNFFGPLLGGASIRAVYLKKVHKISYSHFTSMLMGYYLILFIINCLAALGSIALLPRTDQTAGLVTFFGVWLAVLLLLMVIKLPSRDRFARLESKKFWGKLVNTVFTIEYGWHVLIRDKKLLLKMLALALATYLASLFISYVEFNAIGVSMSLPALGLYTAVVAISLLVSITPGAIGIREGLLLLVSSTIGVTNEQILQVAVIDRAVMFSLLFIMVGLTRSSRFKKFFMSKDIKI